MSLIALALLASAAAAPVDCERVMGAIAKDECELRQSEQSLSDLNCKDRGTQLELNVCSYRDYLRSDIALNRVWAQVAALYREGVGGKVPDPASEWGLYLAAQRAWLTYREKQCDGEAAGYEGGSMQPLVASTCLNRLTAQRTAELKPLLEQH